MSDNPVIIICVNCCKELHLNDTEDDFECEQCSYCHNEAKTILGGQDE